MVFSYRPLPGAEAKIHEAIADITVSMKAVDYLDMPEKVEITDSVVLPEPVMERYRRLKKELVLEMKGKELTAANAAALSGKLTQMANGAVYSDDGDVVEVHDGKLSALEDIVESASGKPILVAYWYRHDRERILKRLDARELKTVDDISDWNEGRIPIALIHASSGHGLNLQKGGSTIVWFGLTWSLELYQQTNARLWRQGQKDRSVFVHHIVAKGTIDERIMEALAGKARVQDALLSAVKAELGGVDERT